MSFRAKLCNRMIISTIASHCTFDEQLVRRAFTVYVLVYRLKFCFGYGDCLSSCNVLHSIGLYISDVARGNSVSVCR